MKCQILFSGENMKNISKCRLLKILPRVLSVKMRLPVFGLSALILRVLQSSVGIFFRNTQLVLISLMCKHFLF